MQMHFMHHAVFFITVLNYESNAVLFSNNYLAGITTAKATIVIFSVVCG